MRWNQGDLSGRRLLTRTRGERGRKKRGCEGGHTKKTDEAFGGLQEGDGVDACIGDGDVCEGLWQARRGGVGLGSGRQAGENRIKRLFEGTDVRERCRDRVPCQKMRVTTCRPSLSR